MVTGGIATRRSALDQAPPRQRQQPTTSAADRAVLTQQQDCRGTYRPPSDAVHFGAQPCWRVKPAVVPENLNAKPHHPAADLCCADNQRFSNCIRLKQPNAECSSEATDAPWWRSRSDPFEHAWPVVVGWLVAEPTATAKELMNRLAQAEPDTYVSEAQLRTLQRRNKTWRADRAKDLILGQLRRETQAGCQHMRCQSSTSGQTNHAPVKAHPLSPSIQRTASLYWTLEQCHWLTS